jgi:DNA-directed RNA polymerase specialized sigma24 family protein
MSFPQTRETLIYRVATKGSEQDWFQFLSDYWLPTCHFAQQQDRLHIEDAEDVAAETFEAVLRDQLLARWVLNRTSKLRTLLCTVVRHILANRARVRKGRRRLLRKKARELHKRTALPTMKAPDESIEHTDQFYVAWVESLLLQAVESLMREYEGRDKLKHFHVLQGRVCEKMTAEQLSQALGIKKAHVFDYFKAARKRLEIKLKELVGGHVRRYCDMQDFNAEFDHEWCRIGRYIQEHGGLEQAIDQVYQNAGLLDMARRQDQEVASTACRLAQAVPELSDSSSRKFGPARKTGKK